MLKRFSPLIILGVGILFSACEPSAKAKVGNVTVVSVAPNGCVASAWSGRTSPEALNKRSNKHINGEIKPSQINTDLMIAIVRNDQVEFETLLESEADLEETNERGCTALIWASALAREGMAVKLINSGANVSKPDATGKTPLMMASRAGNTKIARKLLSKGADVNASQTGGSNEIGQTALHHAVTNKSRSDIIFLLAEAGINLDAVSEHGKTALMNAASYGDIDSVKQLIELGANTNLKSKDGHTVLDYAVMRNRQNVAEYLSDLD